MIGAEPFVPIAGGGPELRQNTRPRRQFRRMTLAIIETDGFDSLEAGKRPSEAYGGILATGKQNKGRGCSHPRV